MKPAREWRRGAASRACRRCGDPPRSDIDAAAGATMA
jgi:hypothetical protein